MFCLIKKDNFYLLLLYLKIFLIEMENIQKSQTGKNLIDNNANNPAHYKLLVLGLAVIMIGVLLRFAADSLILDMVSNVMMLVGLGLGLKSVYNILR